MLGYQENQVEKKDINSIPKSMLALVRMKMSKNDTVRDVKGFKTSLLRYRKMSFTTWWRIFPTGREDRGRGVRHEVVTKVSTLGVSIICRFDHKILFVYLYEIFLHSYRGGELKFFDI